MALLEKIRQKKKILAIVIGGALVAFIVEVGIEALGRGAGKTTVAKVDGDKIEYQAFQQRIQEETNKEQARNQNNPQQQSVDPAVRNAQVLGQMISEKLLESEYEKVGISVTDGEITELMIGKDAHMGARQFAQSVGFSDPAQLNDFLTNPGKYQVQEEQVVQLRAMWDDCKNSVAEEYQMRKLYALVNGGIQANDLDLAQMEEEQTTVAYISFVKKGFESLANDKFPVSDEEIKAEWEKCKQKYAIDEEYRAIHILAAPITPSDADLKAAKVLADKAMNALQVGTGLDEVRKLGSVKIEESPRQKLDGFQNNANLVTFLGSHEQGDVMRDSVQEANGFYTMYKITEKKMIADSVVVDQFQMEGSEKDQKAVLAMLNEGKTAEEIAKTYKKSASKLNDTIQIANIDDEVIEKITNAGSDYFVLDSNKNGALFMRVKDKGTPRMYFKVGVVHHEAYASTKTNDDIHNKLQKFVNQNNNTKDLYKKAKAAGYQIMETLVAGSTPQLQGIKDSRKAIKWAFENKKGDISPIITDNRDVLIVVAIDEVYDEDCLPYTADVVKQELTEKIRASKMGDHLMKQYNGKAKDLEGYASVMGGKVETATVPYANAMAFGRDMGLVGRVQAAQKGKLNGLWKGNDGVYAFVLDKVEKSGRKITKDELRGYYSQRRSINPQLLLGILAKSVKVERHDTDFF